MDYDKAEDDRKFDAQRAYQYKYASDGAAQCCDGQASYGRVDASPARAKIERIIQQLFADAHGLQALRDALPYQPNMEVENQLLTLLENTYGSV